MPRRVKPKQPPALVVAIAGGSGCGKTTLAVRIAERLGKACIVLPQDVYYHDVDEDWFPPRVWNYDHPRALDLSLMVSHVRELKRGHAVDIPSYDFGLYRRGAEMSHLEPAPVLIIEGTLVLANDGLRNLADLRVYVDTPDDIRFIRRVRRDLIERNRDLDTVIHQYTTWNRPMHQQFVAPSREHAHLVIPGGGLNLKAVVPVVGAIHDLRPDLTAPIDLS
ncbi:MAG: uridine kinase [Armatimonadetes bacterium]|nr:uridine kinase [Armatimonadota bacterium]